MVGKYRRKGRSGFHSKVLGMSFILMLGLGMMVLECQAKPAESSVVGNKVKDAPLDSLAVEDTKLELDDPLSDELLLMQTRVKRDEPTTTKSTSTEKPVKGSYENGKGCQDGTLVSLCMH